MASASDSTLARKLPPYLAVVPASRKRLKPPQPAKPDLGPEVDLAVRQTKMVEELAELVFNAATKTKDHTVIALARSAVIEARYAAGVIAGLK